MNDVTVGGSITGGTTICEGISTGTLTLSGHIGDIMKWQKVLGGGSWEDISNNTMTYSEIPSEDGTWSYRAVIQSGVCAQENSSATDVIVNPSAISGIVFATSTQLCTGLEANLTLSGYEGNIQWQESADGITWYDISGANSGSYISGALSENIFYHAVVSLGSCDDAISNSIEINIIENPVAGYTFIADNQELAFINTSTEATSYTWNFGDGNSSTDENPVYTYDASGTYTVELTATNDVCADNLYSESITVTYVGISKIEANISIVPNPNNGMFVIDFGELNTSETSVTVLTVGGQLIYESNNTANVHQIDLSNHSKGIYFIKITLGELVYNTKVMIK